MMDLRGKKIVVLGIGASGEAAAKWAESRGAMVVVSDLKPIGRWPSDFIEWARARGVGIEAGKNDPKTCLSADMVIVSPGIPLDAHVVRSTLEYGIPITGELALAVSLWRGPLIAITGTNGKTTTTSLVGEMFKTAGLPHVTAGNIGVPLLGFLQHDEYNSGEAAVLEVSSFQLDAFSLNRGWFRPPRFNIAAFLNLSPDHLDRYPGLAAYGESKASLFKFQTGSDWAVMNGDDPNLLPFRDRGMAKRLIFGRCDHGLHGALIRRESGQIILRLPESIGGSDEVYSLKNWGLKGIHNLENLAAAILIARVSGIGPAVVQEVISTFKAPPHRIEWVATKNGINYYDDSKGTNVVSVIKAIESIDGPVVLIAGGRGKGEDYSPLRHYAESGRVSAFVLMGEEASVIKDAVGVAVPVFEIVETDGWQAMREAVRLAALNAEDGGAVLLSPACASFDMFEDYRERGLAFKKAVLELEV
ncbi:UDP-N-acetylmuramoyl-L-alanine--D-glutamate ligase [Dissulfurimicrobium hydrothermale]|uniref:UDP-N-acetylmuramoyl-L-alanine--D-glutamate ligase n=2 Tax=Dissulfurimicrobium TaxID=1769732 RepID=UPI001EDBB661|nr:UDP-N-acetylmuramoyl-L-alanine--D-glutamate ligase [Dissulfurimicrobium hydrothermale]UKL12886.1 UDP-N-acetylmuramoyl-L-alanine--D-glutamate ligase [Dissulfurimicrobium hydrothermale]